MLSDDETARYARQVIVPGIGHAGQEKLLASTVLVVGLPRGVEQSAMYLRAAGVRVIEAGGVAFDLAVVAGVSALDAATRDSLVASGKPVCWYELEESGFTSGVSPTAAMPQGRRDDCHPDRGDHDAAACDVASVACGILVGLATGHGAVRFPGGAG